MSRRKIGRVINTDKHTNTIRDPHSPLQYPTDVSSCFIYDRKGSVWPHMGYHISQGSFMALLRESGWAQITVKPPGGQTTSQRVIQAVRTPSKKYGNAGQLKILIKMPFSTVSEWWRLAASWPDNRRHISRPTLLRLSFAGLLLAEKWTRLCCLVNSIKAYLVGEQRLLLWRIFLSSPAVGLLEYTNISKPGQFCNKITSRAHKKVIFTPINLFTEIIQIQY